MVGFETVQRRRARLRERHVEQPGGGEAVRRSRNMIDRLLVDQVGSDLHRMVSINSFFAEHARRRTVTGGTSVWRSRGRPPYRRVSSMR